MGGSIKVTSKYGHGSKFQIWIKDYFLEDCVSHMGSIGNDDDLTINCTQDVFSPIYTNIFSIKQGVLTESKI